MAEHLSPKEYKRALKLRGVSHCCGYGYRRQCSKVPWHICFWLGFVTLVTWLAIPFLNRVNYCAACGRPCGVELPDEGDAAAPAGRPRP